MACKTEQGVPSVESILCNSWPIRETISCTFLHDYALCWWPESQWVTRLRSTRFSCFPLPLWTGSLLLSRHLDFSRYFSKLIRQLITSDETMFHRTGWRQGSVKRESECISADQSSNTDVKRWEFPRPSLHHLSLKTLLSKKKKIAQSPCYLQACLWKENEGW